jgi:uncharacterized protein
LVTTLPGMDHRAQAPTAEFARVRRVPGRARYDRATLHSVLDAGMVGHVGFVRGGRAVVIPMLYGRDGDRLFLHGSVASHLQRQLGGRELCLTVTVVDGLVFARSAFHHSMNYRSAVVFGRAEALDGEGKLVGLRAIAEHLTPGRWEESRPPSRVERRQTSVLELTVDHASVKVRSGGPVDDPDDLALEIWAGAVSLPRRWGQPVTEPDSRVLQVAPSVRRLLASPQG